MLDRLAAAARRLAAGIARSMGDLDPIEPTPPEPPSGSVPVPYRMTRPFPTRRPRISQRRRRPLSYD